MADGYDIKNRRLRAALGPVGKALDRYQAGDFSNFVPTGLHDLDVRLGGGFCRGQVTLIGAPTGSGKTTLLVSMAAAASRVGPTLLVSPEMSVVELAEREVIRRSGHEKWERNPWKVHERREEAAEEHARAMNEMLREDPPLYCLDDVEVSMHDVEACSRELMFEEGTLAAVFIDYAQQVATMDDRTPRYLQVGAVATRSIHLARELGVPVIIASQVNQSTDKQGNVTKSFRESQILEHKSHNVLLFEVTWEEHEDERYVTGAKFVCRKQRNGPLFRLPVEYIPQTYTVKDKERLRDGW